jgi:hypothetical protein
VTHHCPYRVNTPSGHGGAGRRATVIALAALTCFRRSRVVYAAGVGTVEERVGRNEAIFRQVNERIVEVGDELDASRLAIVCECADAACAASIEISLSDYRRAREESAVFIVIPEHLLAGLEEAMFADERSVFVRKRGQAAEAAEQADS